ncbi:MAG: right-handed parallel beta-helix repeat-containing protein, partial [Ruminococcus sp.]|nr:right-handed parallel beta-helix repeat-containing protein [Ruminococcus sp.]
IDAMPYFPSYDKTPCKNISVHDNVFESKFRAVGSHHAVTGKTYDSITVRNNRMINIAGISVYAVYWKNSKIYGNDMLDVGLGVDLRSMINSDSLNFYNLNNLSYEKSESAVSGSKTFIYGNTIKIRSSKNILSKTCGIRALGDYYSADDKTTGTKAGIYRIYNVNIGVDASGKAYPNKISGNLTTGIQVNYGVNTLIKNNVIDLRESSMTSNSGVELRGCERTTVKLNNIMNGVKSTAKGVNAYESTANTGNTNLNISQNTIDGYAYAGVYLRNSSTSTVTDNYIKRCSNASIVLNAAVDTSITLNEMTDGAYGVNASADCGGVSIDSNRITAGTGLYIINTSNIYLLYNSVRADSYAVYLKGTKDITASGNTLSGSYGVHISGGSENLMLGSNTISAVNSGLYAVSTNGINADSNSITAGTNAVFLKTVRDVNITNNKLSGLFGVKLDMNCYNTNITGNGITTTDECIYLNGSSSTDKTEAKTLNITGNILDCPSASAAVRVVYDNVETTIHSNSRSDGAVPVYRFKGDGETSYRKQYGDMTIDNLTIETEDEVTTLSWSTASTPTGYRVYLGEEYLGDVNGTECTIDSYNGQPVTVIPYKTYGNIVHLGVPVSVE